MEKQYYIGIDGGGTKTEAVLIDDNGHICSHSKVGPSNPNDIGISESIQLIVTLIRTLLSNASVKPEQVTLFAGISGVIQLRDIFTEKIGEQISLHKIRVETDGKNLISSELPEGDGACIICGTGSACFLRRGDDFIRIGGWGYLLDSAGSGYDIGRQGIEAVLRASDKRGRETVLTDLFAQALGAPTEQSITKIYEGKKALIAGLAPYVFEAAEKNDFVSCDIIHKNAAAIAEYIEAAWKWLPEEKKHMTSFPVILGGSISQKKYPLWENTVRSLLTQEIPASIRTARNPVIWGTVVEALRTAGVHPDYETMLAIFMQDYQPYITH